MDPAVCLHCERRPALGGLSLCPACQGVRGIRRLYERHRGWTPAWEQHLRRLTERARKRLPLFPEEVPGAAPGTPLGDASCSGPAPTAATSPAPAVEATSPPT
jgi:hypothetical protein